jgi:hypothetical protein
MLNEKKTQGISLSEYYEKEQRITFFRLDHRLKSLGLRFEVVTLNSRQTGTHCQPAGDVRAQIK